MLQEKDLAALKTKLEIPLVIMDLLSDREVFCANTVYALHDMLSDMQPDAALLAMALSVDDICNSGVVPQEHAAYLSVSCARLIEEYGPLWLAHASNEMIDTAYLADVLSFIPEDLEELAELMNMVVSLSVDHGVAVKILDIFSAQSSAQALVAEAFVDLMVQNNPHSFQADIAQGTMIANSHDNIIQFPFGGKA